MSINISDSLGRNSENGIHIVITHVGTLGGLVLGGHGEGKILLSDHCVEIIYEIGRARGECYAGRVLVLGINVDSE